MTSPTPSRTQDSGWLRLAARWTLFAVVLLLLWRAIAGPSSGPSPGTRAVPFVLPLVAGGQGEVSLDSLRGSPSVIEVFASWCSACRNLTPVLKRVAQANRTRTVRFVAISSDQSPELARAAHRSFGLPFPVAWDDGRFSHSYRISALPTVILLDADGQVRHVATGVVREATLEHWLEELGAKRR